MTKRQLTRNALRAAGDLKLLADAMIDVEVDSDGTAWAEVVGVEIVYHPSAGWKVALSDAPHGTLEDAMAEAVKWAMRDLGADPQTKLLNWIFEPKDNS